MVERVLFFLFRVIKSAQFVPFEAFLRLLRNCIGTSGLLVKDWVVDLFKQSVAELAVKFVWTLVPRTVFLNIRAFFW